MKRLTEYIQYSQNSIVSYQFGSLLVFWMLTVQSSRVNSTKSIKRKFHRLQQSMTRKCEFQNKKTEFRFFYFDLIEWTVHGILLNHRTTSTLFHRHPRKFNWIQVQILDNANSPKQKKNIFFILFSFCTGFLFSEIFCLGFSCRVLFFSVSVGTNRNSCRSLFAQFILSFEQFQRLQKNCQHRTYFQLNFYSFLVARALSLIELLFSDIFTNVMRKLYFLLVCDVPLVEFILFNFYWTFRSEIQRTHLVHFNSFICPHLFHCFLSFSFLF